MSMNNLISQRKKKISRHAVKEEEETDDQKEEKIPVHFCRTGKRARNRSS
jgi:hypothetical protein